MAIEINPKTIADITARALNTLGDVRFRTKPCSGTTLKQKRKLIASLMLQTKSPVGVGGRLRNVQWASSEEVKDPENMSDRLADPAVRKKPVHHFP